MSNICRTLLTVCLAAIPTFAQGEIDFWTSSVVRNGISDPAWVGQVVGSPTPDYVLRNGFDLEIWDGALPMSAGPVAVISGGQENPRFVAGSDVDGDGDQDLVDFDPGLSLRVHLQQGGVFLSQAYPNVSNDNGVQTLRFIDIDGSGRKHITLGAQVYVHLPNGTFVPGFSYLVPAGATSVNHHASDYDGDGDPDVVVTYRTGSNQPTRARTWRQTAPGVFTQVADLQLLSSSDVLDLFEPGDWDLDGMPDFLLVSRGPSALLRIRRYEVTSSFSLANRQELRSSNPSGALNVFAASADLNTDGLPDVFISRRSLSFPDIGHEAPLFLRGTPGGDLELYTGWGLSLVPVSGSVSWLLDQDGDGDVELLRYDAINDQMLEYSPGPLGFVPGLSWTIGTTGSGSTAPVLLSTTVTTVTNWLAQTPAGAVPVRFRLIERELVNSSSMANFFGPSGIAPTFTNSLGAMNTIVSTGSVPGVATLSALGFTLRMIRIAGMMSVVSGGDITADPNCLNGPPLVVQAADTLGGPFTSPIGVSIAEDVPGFTYVPTLPSFTNSMGLLSFVPVPPAGFLGTVTFTIHGDGIGTVTSTRTYSNTIPSIVVVSGNNQVSTLNAPNTPSTPFSTPLRVRVLDPNGAPMAGALVSFSGHSSANISPGSVMTDAFGEAATTVTPGIAGQLQIQAASPGACSPVTFTLFTRGLVAGATPVVLFVSLVHENPGMPLLFAVDSPQTPMPFPPFGELYTSVLSPGPNFGWLDGLGVFAPPDPAMVVLANNVWTRSFTVSPALAGVSIVMQTYGVDVNYSFPSNIVISNPVFVTF